MKVLLAAPFGGVAGGISRWTGHIMNYYTSLQDKPCELTLLPMGRSSFVNISSGLAYRIKTAFVDYKKILTSFNAMLRDNDFDVMHLTSSASISLLKDIYMIRQCRRRGIRSVVHFRFGRIPELAQQKNWEWKLLNKVVKMADKVIVLDNSSYHVLVSCGYSNITMLPNPISPEVLDIVSANEDILREEKTILFTGHVVKTKGVYELVEACSEIDGVKLKFVGHVLDEVKEELHRRAKCELEVCGEMPYEDVIKEMLSCDVFALPTYTEGFPNVILESMAASCAIVTTDVGAIPQMLEPEGEKQYGIIIKPENATLLKEALVKMLGDEQLKSECRQNVRKRVVERYSIASIWEQMLQIWSEKY